MAKQSFKTAVGAFVIGGLALLVAGIILLGGGRMFSDDIEYVLYFDGSVSGLNIGAPVVFRGVPMGQVTRISLEANPRDASVTIPVYIRLDENSIVRAGVTGELTDNFRQEILRRLIQRGLRARLQLQSLITGFYDLSRLEGGEYPLEREPVNLYTSLSGLLAAFYNDFTDKGFDMTVELEENLPPVQADSGGVLRVFTNLIRNALDHGQGKMTVRLCIFVLR